MCWCRPHIRTPRCGRLGCVPPQQPRGEVDERAAVAPGAVEQGGGPAKAAGEQAVQDGVTHAEVSGGGGRELREGRGK